MSTSPEARRAMRAVDPITKDDLGWYLYPDGRFTSVPDLWAVLNDRSKSGQQALADAGVAATPGPLGVCLREIVARLGPTVFSYWTDAERILEQQVQAIPLMRRDGWPSAEGETLLKAFDALLHRVGERAD